MIHFRRIAAAVVLTVVLFVYFYGITSLILGYCLGVSIDSYIPTSIDYLQYWKEVYNFRNCLGGTGYFGHEELLSLLNKLGINSPGASHGIGNTLVYTLLALPAWQYDTPIYINLVLTALGVGLYFLISGLSFRRCGLAIFGVISLYPLYYLNAANTFQSVHFLLACLVAGMLIRLFEAEDPLVRRHTWWWLLATVAAGALLRKNWALLLVPLAFIPAVSPKRRLLLILGAFVASGALGFCFDATRSPYPYPEFPEDLRPVVLAALGRGDFTVLWQQLFINFNAFAHFMAKHDFDTVYGSFLIGAAALLLVDTADGVLRRRFLGFGVAALTITVASSAVIYYIFQVMLLKIVLQVFLILFLVTVRQARVRTLALLFLINLLFIPAFFDRFRVLGQEYLYFAEKSHSIDTFREQSAPFFHMKSPDRWGNTLLIFDYPPELLGLPPCIHVMDTREAFLQQRGYQVHTGFVLVPDPAIEAKLLAHNSLRLLASTTAGRLYAVE